MKLWGGKRLQIFTSARQKMEMSITAEISQLPHARGRILFPNSKK